MTADTVETTSITESQLGPPSHGRVGSAAVRLLAVLIAAACALITTNNWCLVILPALLAAFVADHVVCNIRLWFIPRVSVATAVGIAAGMLLSVGPDWAFREAFGVSPPRGVQDVRIWRHYLGGPGEHVLIIEFTADATAFQALVHAHPPLPDSDKVQRWQAAGGGWAQAVDVFAGPGLTTFARSSWNRIRPLEHVEALDLGESNRGSIFLLREPSTERCVALHVRF